MFQATKNGSKTKKIWSPGTDRAGHISHFGDIFTLLGGGSGGVRGVWLWGGFGGGGEVSGGGLDNRWTKGSTSLLYCCILVYTSNFYS